MKDSKDKDGHKPSASFVAGTVALIFLIIGYQASLFIHKAAVSKVIADRDTPDTVVITQTSSDSKTNGHFESKDVVASSYSNHSGNIQGHEYGIVRDTFIRRSSHSKEAQEMADGYSPRRVESFHFDPNTVSLEDLERLGFSQKQAQSIDNYRQKGGRFRRKSDFAKSYVVDDSVYQRLEKFIDIPKTDINTADSATFETLPGIGKYFASKMVSHREELGGYSYPEQLMDIWHFDEEKYNGLKDLIFVGTSGVAEYSLWRLSEAELARHPYIGKRAAHGIALFRQNTPKEEWTVENLEKNGILDRENASKLAKCRIEAP